jgi:hypothetical protein
MTVRPNIEPHDAAWLGRAASVPVNPVSLESEEPFDPVTGEVLSSGPVTALDTAKSYIQRGWNPTPIPFKSKIPPGDAWQKRVIDNSNVGNFFNGQPQNVGVIMGPSSDGLTDVDLDCPEAIAIAAFILPKTGAIFGRPSARMAHWLYRTDLGQTSEKSAIRLQDPSRPIDGVTLVELRIGGDKGAQTVFPGSIHESGETISWEDAGEPAVVDGAELIKQVKLVAVGALLVRYWPGLGARHDAALGRTRTPLAAACQSAGPAMRHRVLSSGQECDAG